MCSSDLALNPGLYWLFVDTAKASNELRYRWKTPSDLPFVNVGTLSRFKGTEEQHSGQYFYVPKGIKKVFLRLSYRLLDSLLPVFVRPNGLSVEATSTSTAAAPTHVILSLDIGEDEDGQVWGLTQFFSEQEGARFLNIPSILASRKDHVLVPKELKE